MTSCWERERERERERGEREKTKNSIIILYFEPDYNWVEKNFVVDLKTRVFWFEEDIHYINTDLNLLRLKYRRDLNSVYKFRSQYKLTFSLAPE